ncbi:MAG: DUF6418 domain-containing protein [Terracidiphilus sp.]
MPLWLNAGLVGIFALLVWRMAKDNACALMPIASISLVLAWQGISIAYLESGVYSPELMLTSHPTGGTARYVGAIVSFLGVYWIVFRTMVSRRWLAQCSCPPERMERAARLALPIILLTLAATFVLLCYAPREAIDSRSKFLLENPVLMRDRLLDYQPYLALILGFATGITQRAGTRALGYSTLLLMLLVLYLYGNKFSGITETFFLFSMPFVALLKMYPVDRRVWGVTARRQGLLVTAALLIAVTEGQVREIKYLQSTGGEGGYLLERVFILQGGIWWITDDQAVNGVYQPGLREFAEFVRGEHYFQDSSLMYLMTRAIGYDLTYKIFMFDDSLFTGTFPAIFYEIGGRGGPVLFSALTGLIVAVAAGYATRKILRGQALLALLACGIFLPLDNLASAAEFTPLLSLGLLAKFGLVLLVESMTLMRSFARISTPGDPVAETI